MCGLLDKLREDGTLGSDVPVIGVIKSPLATTEDEERSQQNGWPPTTTGVVPFVQDYFNCAQSTLFCDESREVYALLGNRTLSIPWRKVLTRPWAAWRDLQTLNQRMKDKDIVAQSGGEGAILGGICVIGPKDRAAPSYVYREQIGAPIPVAAIEAAVRDALGVQPPVAR